MKRGLFCSNGCGKKVLSKGIGRGRVCYVCQKCGKTYPNKEAVKKEWSDKYG